MAFAKVTWAAAPELPLQLFSGEECNKKTISDVLPGSDTEQGASNPCEVCPRKRIGQDPPRGKWDYETKELRLAGVEIPTDPINHG